MDRDRINEVYRGSIFSKVAQESARKRIHWIVENVKGNRVLDVGCSQGITSILLARDGKTVIGIDKELIALAVAETEAKAEAAAVRRRLTFLCLDAFNTAFRDGLEFDTVILGQVIEHVHAVDTLIEIAHKMCSPDGRLILTTPFGIIDHPDHAHVFFPLSLLKLTVPRFEPEELAIIGKRICLTCKKGDGMGRISPPWLDYLCALSEDAFAEIERGYLKTMASLREKIAAQQENYQRLKGQLERQAERTNALWETIQSSNEAYRAQSENLDLTKNRLRKANREIIELRKRLEGAGDSGANDSENDDTAGID